MKFILNNIYVFRRMGEVAHFLNDDFSLACGTILSHPTHDGWRMHQGAMPKELFMCPTCNNAANNQLQPTVEKNGG